jgi:hypothetical protein
MSAKGELMERQFGHCGIAFFIQEAGDGLWEWKLAPPNSVLGLWPETGMVSGEIGAAIVAARRAIEHQTRRYTNEAVAAL